jgi:transcriptional regulator with XRE-family HTH domain
MELRIKDICKSKGVSIAKLGELIGVSTQNIHLTLNKSNPTLSTLEKISNALDVPVSDLISDPRNDKQANNLCPYCGKELHITIT